MPSFPVAYNAEMRRTKANEATTVATQRTKPMDVHRGTTSAIVSTGITRNVMRTARKAVFLIGRDKGTGTVATEMLSVTGGGHDSSD